MAVRLEGHPRQVVHSGQLRSFTVGRARFVSVDELRRFVREREAAAAGEVSE